MNRNKFLGAFIAAAIAFGSLTPAFADVDENISKVYEQQKNQAKISKEQARDIGIKRIKDTFGVDVSNFDENINFGLYMENYTWNLSFNKYDNKNDINFFISIDSNTGKIQALSKGEYTYSNENKEPTINKERAKEIANNYIKKINPDKLSQVKLIDEYNYDNDKPMNYYFRYVRTVNGVEFDSNYINIDIDAVNGKVIGYSYSWSEDIDFPKTDNIMNKEEAEKLFSENIKINLNYINQFDTKSNKLEKSKLVYNYRFDNGSMIDAKEGKMITWGYNKEKEETKDIDNSKKEEILKNAKDKSKLEKELNKEEAVKLINKKIKEFYNIDSTGLSYLELIDNNVNTNKVWVADFGKEDDKGNIKDGGSITIDALTGELVSISKWNNGEKPNEIFAPKLTWDEAYDKAIDTIAKYFPEKIKDIKTEQIKYPMTYEFEGKEMPVRYAYFNFPRLVNGVEYYYNNISVTVDMKTGKIHELNCFWDDKVEFESTDNIISKEEAKKIFLNENKPKLIYMTINTNDDYTNPKYETKLIFMFSPVDLAKPVYEIDAHTGKAINPNIESY